MKRINNTCPIDNNNIKIFTPQPTFLGQITKLK